MNQIAVIQINANDQVEPNLRAAKRLLQQAADGGAKLALLPENFALLQSQPGQLQAIAEQPGDGRMQSFLAEMAARHNMWIIGGTVPIAGPKRRVYSRCIVFNDRGAAVGHYDKIHLFDVQIKNGEQHRESDSVIAGDRASVVTTPFGKIGLSICYDLRFPELYRRLVDLGAILIAVPSAFTRITGQAHWHVLLRARAIENQVYVMAAAQSGDHVGGRRTYGHSLVISPWGKVISQIEAGNGVIFAAVSEDEIACVRSQLPALDHRRNLW